jgi:hypothetical protein
VGLTVPSIAKRQRPVGPKYGGWRLAVCVTMTDSNVVLIGLGPSSQGRGMTLRPGTLFGNRFDIDRMITRGGMGVIYRAHDRFSGQRVALKLLLQAEELGSAAAERFIREAQLLAQLHHPSVVSYVAHGQTAEGQLYLATEWLEGEDLSSRLVTTGLTLAESFLCIRTAAAGLQAAHERGIVHRDVKPGNLFLRDGRVEKTTVLDFGIARPELMAQVLTATGCAIGTPTYMAPEQARGERLIGPPADIFSLGCVWFQCLTGRPPFSADQPMAVLSKILSEEAPSIFTFRPDLPEAVEVLLRQMLAKDPRQRPQHGGALRDALDAIKGQLLELGAPNAAAEAELLISGESQQLLCVIVGVIAQRTGEDVATFNDLALADELPTIAIASQASPLPEQEAPLRTMVAEVARSYGGQVKWVGDGSLVVTLAGRKPATDLVHTGARCALAIAKAWPAAQVSMATGRGTLTEALPRGEAIERAFMLARSQPAGSSDHTIPNGKAVSVPGIRVDDASTGLLDGRYQLNRDDGGVVLVTGEFNPDEGRRLLGKPTPCIGRDQELNLLAALFTSCVENAEAHSVLITAPEGLGKSRLKHEFLRRMQTRPQAPLIIAARGDMQNPAIPYLLLGQALRRLAQVQEGLPVAEQRERFTAQLGQQVNESDRQFVWEFLGELCGIHFPDADSAKLRAARLDPRLMREQITRAFTLLLEAECQRGAVIVVIDDLQWGDTQSIQLLDVALRELRNQPLLVMALGRPEVNEHFPNIWKSHKLQQLPLKPLAKRACQRLIEHVIGKSLEPVAMARLIEQSSGNALLLEELIRMVGEGRIGVIPDSVLAMVQIRIFELPLRLRRVLLAASVFGPEFWSGGVAMLTAGGRDAEGLELELGELMRAEFIESQQPSRYAGETEYCLRNPVVREAAYGLLTQAERRTAHRLAGGWLKQVGESDPMTLALHYELGGAPEVAIPYYVQAAERALERAALEDAIRIAKRGQACGAVGQSRGELLAIETLGNAWLWRVSEAMRLLLMALELLPPACSYSCILYGFLVSGELLLGRAEDARLHNRQLLQLQPAPAVHNSYIRGAVLALAVAVTHCEREISETLLARIQEVQRQSAALDSNVAASVCHGFSDYARAFQSDPWQVRQLAREAAVGHKAAGDRTFYLSALIRCGQGSVELGETAEGIQILRDAVAQSAREHDQFFHGQARIHLGAALAGLPTPQAWQEAEDTARWVLAAPDISGGYRGWAQGILAQCHLQRGDFAQAEVEATGALSQCKSVPQRRVWVKSLLARCLIGQQRATAAVAADILDEIKVFDGAGYMEVAARLTAAEVLFVSGEVERARSELAATLRQIELRAAKIPDAACRADYLAHIAENVRARQLAGQWLRDPERSPASDPSGAPDCRSAAS